MTLRDIKDKLFPTIYRTRSGAEVEITGFAFIGRPHKGHPLKYIWDENMNCIWAFTDVPEGVEGLDCMELIEEPPSAKNKVIEKVLKDFETKRKMAKKADL
jgi:hypothetical protein